VKQVPKIEEINEDLSDDDEDIELDSSDEV